MNPRGCPRTQEPDPPEQNFGPIVNLAPRGPNEREPPDLLRFSESPDAIFTRRQKRNPMRQPFLWPGGAPLTKRYPMPISIGPVRGSPKASSIPPAPVTIHVIRHRPRRNTDASRPRPPRARHPAVPTSPPPPEGAETVRIRISAWVRPARSGAGRVTVAGRSLSQLRVTARHSSPSDNRYRFVGSVGLVPRSTSRPFSTMPFRSR